MSGNNKIKHKESGEFVSKFKKRIPVILKIANKAVQDSCDEQFKNECFIHALGIGEDVYIVTIEKYVSPERMIEKFISLLHKGN